MKVQIKRFSVHQTAKVISVISMVVMFVFMLPFSLFGALIPAGSQSGMAGFGLAMILFMPIIQGIVMYLSTAIGLWFYNRVSGRIGGFEFQYEAVDQTPEE